MTTELLTLDTELSLRKAVADRPGDALARLVYADWLGERGRDTEAVHQRRVAAVLSGDYGQTSSAAALEVWPQICSTPRHWLEAELARANGRRRTRTLNANDLTYCTVRALNSGDWYARGGGTVANRYGYPAWQTVCVAAVRSDGRVRVGVGVNRAAKGSSLTTVVTGLTAAARPEQFRAWADEEVIRV